MSSTKLILPDTVAPAGDRKLALPESTKTYNCLVCGENFLHKHRYLRHVGACAAKNRESLITVSEEHKAEIDADPFQRVWDPEALDWVLERKKRRERG
jgi:hypothetical protein